MLPPLNAYSLDRQGLSWIVDTVTFEIADAERFQRLVELVGALAAAKAADDFRDHAYWESFLDDRSRAAFWWPTEAEAREWQERWFATPVEKRWSDPSLRTLWMFGSLVDAVRHGEFEQLRCRRTSGGGAIEFVPTASPFGGTDWMRALIEAFGGEVTDDTAG